MKLTSAPVAARTTVCSASICDSCGGSCFSFSLTYALRTNNSPNGIGELYSYLPLTGNNADVLAKVPPKTIESNNYGFSVGRGALTFHRGAWNTIAERISLNDPGKSNGKCCSAPLKKLYFAENIHLRKNTNMDQRYNGPSR